MNEVFSCTGCSSGWTGVGCDLIDCVHGKPDELEQKCICEQPYSGQRCNALQTADVYSYYNRKVNLPFLEFF